MSEARYILDTNILSDLINRGHDSRVRRHLAAGGDRYVQTSVIVAAEVRYGVAKRGSAALAARADAVLGSLPILPFDEPADRRYGELRAHLERKGEPIGPNDLLIAAHCLALGMRLVTANVEEFERVPALFVENWLAGTNP